MFTKFINDIVNPISFKAIISEEEMLNLSKKEGVYFVKSPVMYRLYTMYMGESKKISERSAFFRMCGNYLYYERFICSHGDEYYYYIKFNTKSKFYQEHAVLIKEMILASDPENLLNYTGNKDLTTYNLELKGELKNDFTKRTS